MWLIWKEDVVTGFLLPKKLQAKNDLIDNFEENESKPWVIIMYLFMNV